MVEAAGHKDGAETLAVLLSEAEEEVRDELVLDGWPTEVDRAMSVAAERGYTGNIRELLKYTTGTDKFKVGRCCIGDMLWGSGRRRPGARRTV